MSGFNVLKMINRLIIRMRRSDMIRKVTLAALMTAAIALPVMAQDVKPDANKVDRGKTGPTESMDTQVPTMKSTDKPAASTTGAQPNAAAPDKPMSTTTAPASPSNPPANSTADATIKAGSIILSQQDEKLWIGKPVYSKDEKKIGEVESFRRGPSGEVIGMNAGIGGFLGLGETHVMLTSSQFKLQGDRVIADVASAEAKNLPKAK
jgi:PRC-barrel domain